MRVHNDTAAENMSTWCTTKKENTNRFRTMMIRKLWANLESWECHPDKYTSIRRNFMLYENSGWALHWKIFGKNYRITVIDGSWWENMIYLGRDLSWRVWNLRNSVFASTFERYETKNIEIKDLITKEGYRNLLPLTWVLESLNS